MPHSARRTGTLLYFLLLNGQVRHKGTGKILTRAQTRSYYTEHDLDRDESMGHGRRPRLHATRGQRQHSDVVHADPPVWSAEVLPSPRRIVYVSRLGWGRCWYNECRYPQQFQKVGAQQCESCRKWLDIVIDAISARHEFTVHYMQYDHHSTVTCDCGAQLEVYGQGMKRCTRCENGMIDVRPPRRIDASTLAATSNKPTVYVDINGHGICANPSCTSHIKKYTQYFVVGEDSCAYCEELMKVVPA